MTKVFKNTNRFDSLKLGLASPEDILSWSFGEVKNQETINYRTQKPEPGGLFCEIVFGPETDFTCSCGKFKGAQYHGITCDKCKVEVTRASERRERMGHIDFATPIAHTWFLKKIPSKMSVLLGMKSQEVQRVVYFSAYLISEVNEDRRKQLEKDIKVEFDKKIADATRKETKVMLNELYKDRVRNLSIIVEGSAIDETEYYVYSKQFPGLFKGEKGGEAIYNLLKKLDLKKLEKRLQKDLAEASVSKSAKIRQQLILVRDLIKSGNKPEHMFLTKLPVIPAGIRPLVALDGGQYASSDLNDLYRLVIIRNNRLKNFIEDKAPRIFIDTQKRLLQEAVDALIDKDAQTTAKFGKGQNARQLKPIADYLKGKSGYFRENLLGKRVDYSGRSVIVVGPHLKIDECGLPKIIALELFRPFIIGELINRELAFNVKGAQRMISDGDSVIWEVLEEVIKGKYVLLNRQPTLHRQGIQAFKPILIEGKAIEISPLVCKAYNADFDGDQMTIHLPISEEAQTEAREILISSKNITKPGSGEINASPSQDMVLGCYWATKIIEGAKGEGRYFSSVSEAITASDFEIVNVRAKIKVLLSDKAKYGDEKDTLVETTVGRLLFNNILPKEIHFVNEEVDSKKLTKIVKNIVDTFGPDNSSTYLDKIKEFGFKFSTMSGTTFAWSDLVIPKGRDAVLNEAFKKGDEIFEQYNNGLISRSERKRKNVELWQMVKSEMEVLTKESVGENSPLGDMISSGARGSYGGLNKMVGMFGVVASSSGGSIEQPVIQSIKEGIGPIDYFNSSFGARKGTTDTALKTAGAGYQTRKLYDVAQEIRIIGQDCGTTRGFILHRKTPSGLEIAFSSRIKGRYTSEDLVGKKGIILKKNGYIDLEASEAVEEDETIERIKVRSPITCRYNKGGVCAKCYGDDKARGEIVDIGEAVGTIAAQSIGEPGTQLTMRTFHQGGAAQIGGDITSGLPRIKEIFDRTTPKALAILSHIDGTIESIAKNPDGSHIIHINAGAKKVSAKDKEYTVPANRYINVSQGQEVKKGQFLTDGSADLQELLKYTNKENTQEYIFAETNKVYESQGEYLSPVHFEIIIKQMFSRVSVKDPGDSNYTEGEVIEIGEVSTRNEELEKEGKKQIETENVVSSIVYISTSRNNFLSAASFQNSTSILIRAAIEGARDTLDGVKENIILARLVPIGSAFEGSRKHKILSKVKEDIDRRVAEKEKLASNE